MKNSNKTAKVLGALIAGTIIGAALGVLFAPKKGNETLDMLSKSAKDLKRDVKKKLMDEADNLLNKAGALENFAKEKGDDFINSIEREVNQLKNKTKN